MVLTVGRVGQTPDLTGLPEVLHLCPDQVNCTEASLSMASTECSHLLRGTSG